MISNISPSELRSWIRNGNEFTLIDVREPWEHSEFNIGGELIPLNEIAQRYTEIPVNKSVVFYCRKGIRSTIAIQRLANRLPNGLDVYNLSGGVEAWQRSED